MRFKGDTAPSAHPRRVPCTAWARRYLEPPAEPALLLWILGLGLGVAAGMLAWRAASRRSA